MKITDDRKEFVFFGDLEVTELLESRNNEGNIYMKLLPVSIPGIKDHTTYNAVNVNTGRYVNFKEDERVIVVHGSFHRERG